MTDRPILFSSAMVRALLDGRKQQTRRILNNAPSSTDGRWRCDPVGPTGWRWVGMHGYPTMPCVLRFAKGDHLYVREHWRTESHAYDDLAPSDMDADYPVIYGADADWSINKSVGRFRQTDAIAEGAFIPTATSMTIDCETVDPRDAFQALWNSINGAGSWDRNEWVVAISFTVERRNIDQGAQP